MLERTGVKATDPMTSIQWETTFAKISSALDDLPMTYQTQIISDLKYYARTASNLAKLIFVHLRVWVLI